jgi:formylglycine-generating enzyme required for sulfatase activity
MIKPLTYLVSLLLVGYCFAFNSNSKEIVINKVWTQEFESSIENYELSFDQKGIIIITSEPESGMTIYINNQNTGKTTPATFDDIPVGKHVIKLVGEWYRPQEKTVDVVDGQSVKIAFTMVANYAELTVNTSSDAIIYIDGKVKGDASWKGRVKEGVSKVRVEKEGYTTREWEVSMVRGRDQKIDLMMSPKTGILEVKTEPSQAMISLDGKMYGMTPKVIPDLLLGNYNMTIEKQGYTSVSMRVVIEDAKTTTVDIKLIYGKEITVSSQPSGAYLILQEDTIGVTPLSLILKFGNHEIKLVKNDEVLVETIHVSPTGKKVFDYILKQSNDPFYGQMVFVKGGTFKMGDTFGIGNREERPVHQVTLGNFYIGKYEVTQSQWKLIMGDNPSHYKDCDKCPVERVSWNEVQIFLTKLNMLTGKNYRLPTEAEWEYAAKGGELSQGFRYAGGNNINFVSWYSGNSQGKTQPVGTMNPNELGIYDMSGNVYEWCSDWFDYYTESPKTNPEGPEQGEFKIVKGGSWYGYIGGSRISCRASDDPGNKRSYIGFRVAMSP